MSQEDLNVELLSLINKISDCMSREIVHVCVWANNQCCFVGEDSLEMLFSFSRLLISLRFCMYVCVCVLYTYCHTGCNMVTEM